MMKKVYLIFVVALMIITGCMPITKPTEKVENDNLGIEENNSGIWKILYFVDEFQEPTEEGYITTTIKGTFSNDFAQDYKLEVDFIITSPEAVDIKFYEYDHVLKKIESKVSYKVLVKDAKEEKHTLSAYHNYDRLSFNTSESKKMYDILAQGGTIKFNITGSYSFSNSKSGEYIFTINNADGLENTYNKLTGNPEKSENDLSSSTKDEDFKTFIQKFTSDEEFQLSRIEFPLGYADSKEEWEFLDANDIFEGTSKKEPYTWGRSDEEIFFIGKFSKDSDNKYHYTRMFVLHSDSEPDDDFYELGFGLSFTKIDGEWMLTEIIYGE